MEALTQQRCLNHLSREAVARCPECRQFFCRECVTEHDDRVICAACLRKVSGAPLRERLRFEAIGRIGRCLLGLFAAWVCFYLTGRLLLVMPTDVHEGTVWKRTFWDR